MKSIIDYVFKMKILFVCTANICRSVMAEGILKKLIANSPGYHSIFVSSAGVDALVNFTPDQKTIDVCLKHNINIATHKAQQLTNSMIKDMSPILCMEKTHKLRILSAFPKDNKQVFLLKEYLHKSSHNNPEIEDPTGKSKIKYEECYREIEKELRRILPAILKAAS